MLARTSALAAAMVKLTLTAVACSSEGSDEAADSAGNESTAAINTDHGGHGDHGTNEGVGDHSGDNHPADGGPAPEGMVEAANPTYPVGTEVTLTAEHMPGMEGAKAAIVGAFDDTYTYEISYTPTNGGGARAQPQVGSAARAGGCRSRSACRRLSEGAHRGAFERHERSDCHYRFLYQ